MANRVTVPVTNFETLSPPWSLQSLDQDLLALQSALNDASLGYVTTGTDTGTTNNYSIPTPAFGTASAYNQGMTVFLVPANSNTGPSTLTVGVLGSQPITDAGGNALVSGALVAGQGVWLTYSGTSFYLNAPSTGLVTSVRLRSFSSIQNPNFEVQQRNVGTVLTSPAHLTFIEDRWQVLNTATFSVSLQRVGIGPLPTLPILLPGTNFGISNGVMRFTLNAQRISLATTDTLGLRQTVEGSLLRELIGDVHSISLLVRSSVANLTFGVVLGDNPHSMSLSKLCTLGAANTWTLITLPNLPVWPTSGHFSYGAGGLGYEFNITLAAGSANQPPANDVWQTGAYYQGTAGQMNFAGQAVNSTFDIAFVQHEPGAPTTLQDKPFSQNYDECLRYYTKSYPYAVVPGTVNNLGNVMMYAQAGLSPFSYIPFKKTMAKTPTLNGYSITTGASGTVRDATASLDKTISNFTIALGDSGFGGFTVSSPNAGIWQCQYHYTADTGW